MFSEDPGVCVHTLQGVFLSCAVAAGASSMSLRKLIGMVVLMVLGLARLCPEIHILPSLESEDLCFYLERQLCCGFHVHSQQVLITVATLCQIIKFVFNLHASFC